MALLGQEDSRGSANAFTQLQDPVARMSLARSLAERFPPPPRHMFASATGTGNVTLDPAGVARAKLTSTPTIVQPTTPGLYQTPTIDTTAALQIAQALQASPGQNGDNANLNPQTPPENPWSNWQPPPPQIYYIQPPTGQNPAPNPSTPAPVTPTPVPTSSTSVPAVQGPANTPITPATTSPPVTATPPVNVSPIAPTPLDPSLPQNVANPIPSPTVNTPPPTVNTPNPPGQQTPGGIGTVVGTPNVIAPPTVPVIPQGGSGQSTVQNIGSKAHSAGVQAVQVGTGLLGNGISKKIQDLIGIGNGGNLAKESRVFATSNGVFYDQNSKVIARVQIPTSGTVAVPGLNRNGNPIFVDSAGNILKKQQSGGGFDRLNFNLRTAGESPAEINGVTAKWDAYTPSDPTEVDLTFGTTTQQVGSIGGVNPNVQQPGAFNPNSTANQQKAVAAPPATIGIPPGLSNVPVLLDPKPANADYSLIAPVPLDSGMKAHHALPSNANAQMPTQEQLDYIKSIQQQITQGGLFNGIR